MVTDVDRCLPDGSLGIQCCQPSKSCKNWWKYQKNAKKIGWQHCICRGITRFLGIIGIHRCHRCHRLIIGYYRWHRCETRYIAGKVSIGYPRISASDKRGRIESYCHRLRSVTECPRLNLRDLSPQLLNVWKCYYTKPKFCDVQPNQQQLELFM
jgi:hypothetical protein